MCKNNTSCYNTHTIKTPARYANIRRDDQCEQDTKVTISIAVNALVHKWIGVFFYGSRRAETLHKMWVAER